MPVVDHRERRELGQIAHEQRQVLLVVEPADAAHALDRILVVQMARERVARIGRQRDHAAATHDFGRLPDKARLRIIRVNPEELGHGDKGMDRRVRARAPEVPPANAATASAPRRV
ncbi:hypothetical protein BMMON2_33520 [Burkholderia mallei]